MYDVMSNLIQIKDWYSIDKDTRDRAIEQGIAEKPTLTEKQVRTEIAKVKKEYFELFGEKLNMEATLLEEYMKGTK